MLTFDAKIHTTPVARGLQYV